MNFDQNMEVANLANWRISPHSQWAFQNIRQLIPTAAIPAARDSGALHETNAIDDTLELAGTGGKSLGEFLTESFSDSLVILQRGRKVYQWNAPHCDVNLPHIVFSVSKSITAMLAGILVGDGALDVTKPVLHYLPGVKGSAYEDASLQQLLDMSVALDFNESYLGTSEQFARYRNATGWNPVDQTNPGPGLEAFLYGLRKSDSEHGDMFQYKSPNSDLLGLLIERVAAESYADFMSSQIWAPMGAETDSYVTVDRCRLARGAGGVCVTIDDLARFGQLILEKGAVNSRQLIPEGWIEDTMTRGSRKAWQKGEFSSLLPSGCYRNKWYQTGDQDQSILALGIHGQWLYLNPKAELVIVKMSSQPEPVDDALDRLFLTVLGDLRDSLR